MTVASVRDTLFGAKGDGVHDDTAAGQKMFDDAILNGDTGYFPRGNYLITGNGLSINRASMATVADLTRVDIRGEGPGNTCLTYAGVGTCLSYTGSTLGSGAGASGFFGIDGLQINGNGSGGNGLSVNLAAYWTMRDVLIQNIGAGLTCVDTLSWLCEASRIIWCRQGINAYSGAFSPPNAITFIGCTVGLNAEYGMLIEHCDTFTFTGGSIESNGLSVDGGYGIQLYQPGDNGAVAANFLGVHFENNPSVADILVNAGSQPFAVNAIGCSFSRNDPAKFSINNIRVNTSEGSRVYLNVIGCGFRGFNGYVPSAKRPFIQMPDDGTVILNDLGSVYDNDLGATS